MKKKITVISVIVILAVAVLFTVRTNLSAQQSAGTSNTENANTELNLRRPVIADQDLIIQIADITENALYFPVDIDGLRMEVLAVRAPDGTIRTAFNTCQVCYTSGRGHFVQVNALLVCQNCGNRYRMSQVERQAGGCNPAPIFAANKIQTAETITISIDFLRQARGMFQRWSRS